MADAQAMTIPEKAVQAGQDATNGNIPPIMLERALTAAAPHMSGVKVKQLDWVKVGDEHYAKTPFGTYRLDRLKALSFGGHSLSRPYLILDEAKDAAQANYEKRILSALEPPPAREQALEEAEHAVGSTVLKHRPSDYSGLSNFEAYEAGQLNGLERAQASLRALKSQPAPQAGGGE